MNKIFSVIIPTYNRAGALRRSLESLRNQEFKSFEVIVCDDGSTDDTKVVVEDAKSFLDVKYIYSTNFGGPARPRNLGIEKAEGEWVCFLDSDDCFHKSKLQRIVNLDLDGIDFIYHDLEIFQHSSRIGRTRSRDLSRRPYTDLLSNLNTIATSSVCVRRSALKSVGGFSEDATLIAVEDIQLWIRMAKMNIRWKYIPEILGSYYLGDDNITSGGYKQIKRLVALYRPHIRAEINKGLKLEFTGALYYQLGRIYRSSGSKIKAEKCFAKALQLGSFRIRFKALIILLVLQTRFLR